MSGKEPKRDAGGKKGRKRRQEAFREEIQKAGGVNDLRARRFRLVGREVPSPAPDQRWFAVDDIRLYGTVLALAADSILDEEAVEGRGGEELISVSVPGNAPVLMVRRTTVGRVLAPMARELRQVYRQRLLRNLPGVLMHQAGGGGGGGILRNKDDEDPEIELTFGAAKDRNQFDPDTPDWDSEIELTLMQLKESAGRPDDDDYGLFDPPDFGELEPDDEDEDEDGLDLPPFTLVFPSETTGREQDELVFRTDVLEDPLLTLLSDFSYRYRDRPEGDEEPEPSTPEPGPWIPGTLPWNDVRPPYKHPLDDLRPPGEIPGELEQLFDFLGRIADPFTLPGNPDPEADPTERRYGLDMRIWPWPW